ncbi:VPS16 protein, partial [Grallaria varia]|nr:VPS16 protein [Grallaria varia]
QVQQKDKSDEEVAQAINHKLGDTPGISYSEIATRAYDCGRAELAIKLLEYEPRSGEQVPLLLKMKRSKLALGKAIESGDTDLVYTVVLHLKNELNRGTFFMTLQNQPVALSLYRQFCRHQERDTLKDLYNQDDNHQELGNFHIHSSYSEKRIEGRVGALQNALDEFNKARNDFAAKRHLQEHFDKPYLDLSLHDTVSTLILDGHHKRAEQLYREFRIPDKRCVSPWLGGGSGWGGGAACPVPQRVPVLVPRRDLEQAAEAAMERRSEAEMNLVLSRCSPSTDGAVAEKLTRARAQLIKK